MRGHLIMSQREREYLKELARVKKKEMRLSDASRVLGLSYRHTRRIYKRYVEEGDQGLVHRSRGKKANPGKWGQFPKKRIRPLKSRYRGFCSNPGSEKLEEEDGLKVDHETL